MVVEADEDGRSAIVHGCTSSVEFATIGWLHDQAHHLLPCLVMDYLWTPWRYAYVSAAEKTTECVFCNAVAANDDAKTRIVYRAQHCFVILNTIPTPPAT